ncbi:hypothetical protein GCM10027568_00400 [Humibacter soli]
MLGDPEPLIAEPLGELSETDAARHGIRIGLAGSTAGEIEHVQGHTAKFGHTKVQRSSVGGIPISLAG